MDVRNVKRFLAVLVVLAILLAGMPLAAAGMDKAGDYKEKYGGEKYGEKGARSGDEVKGVYLVISKADPAQTDDRSMGGASGNAHPFSITGMAVQGDEDKSAVFQFDKPLKGVYDVSNHMAYISTVNFMPSTAKMGTSADLSLSTSGASAIIKMEDVKKLYTGKDYSLMEFAEVYLTTPDGKVTELELGKPATIVYSKDRNLAVIDFYPTVTESMMNAFMGKEQMNFSSGTMSLKDLSQMEEAATEKSIDYVKPESVKSPAREITGKT